MESIDKFIALSDRVKQLLPHIKTEEATKQSLILPFFQLLGFDVFNPLEFCPEYTADVGIKKGERVDYAILIDGKPLILIEAKSATQKLEKHDSQLFRYFGTTDSKFAILTNGIEYKFYTDLDNLNKMDEKPFFVLDMTDINDQTIEYLKNFEKLNINVESIISSASELKYLNLAKNEIKMLLENPTDEFLKLVILKLYDGSIRQSVLDKFKPIIKRAITQYVNEKMSNKFKETLAVSDAPVEPEKIDSTENKVVTTIEELNAYAIVKSILRQHVSPKRLVYKDTESYLSIVLDDNIRKWICRIEANGKKLYIVLPDSEKKPLRYQLENLDMIYDYSDNLLEILKRYL